MDLALVAKSAIFNIERITMMKSKPRSINIVKNMLLRLSIERINGNSLTENVLIKISAFLLKRGEIQTLIVRMPKRVLGRKNIDLLRRENSKRKSMQKKGVAGKKKTAGLLQQMIFSFSFVLKKVVAGIAVSCSVKSFISIILFLSSEADQMIRVI